jgi:hypothetical protein
LRYKSKNRKRNRDETAHFLDERIGDMSAEILSEAEIKASHALEMDTNMLSKVKSTKDAASAGYYCYRKCAALQVGHAAKKNTL